MPRKKKVAIQRTVKTGVALKAEMLPVEGAKEVKKREERKQAAEGIKADKQATEVAAGAEGLVVQATMNANTSMNSSQMEEIPEITAKVNTTKMKIMNNVTKIAVTTTNHTAPDQKVKDRAVEDTKGEIRPRFKKMTDLFETRA